MTDIDLSALDRELKKGAAELLLLSVLEARPRHGYELGKLIEALSGGRLVFHLDSLYPLLYRLEERGWIKGTWVEKAGERRRRFYRLTPTGQRVLLRQRQTWDEFVEAVRGSREGNMPEWKLHPASPPVTGSVTSGGTCSTSHVFTPADAPTLMTAIGLAVPLRFEVLCLMSARSGL